MFISRRTGGSGRWTVWKVGILFLGAGTWVAGVIAENFQVTAAAIIVIAIGLVLSLVERSAYRARDVDAADDEEQGGEAEERGEPAESPETRPWESSPERDDSWPR